MSQKKIYLSSPTLASINGEDEFQLTSFTILVWETSAVVGSELPELVSHTNT
jgi:hypothetical protein